MRRESEREKGREREREKERRRERGREGERESERKREGEREGEKEREGESERTTSRDVMTTMSNFGVIPWQALHLIEKLSLLGLNTSVCNWILNFLTGRPQSVRSWNSFSSTTTLSTGAPQGCVLSPLLFTLLTHDCAAMHSSNHIVKFTDDTTMVGLISKNDESAYREEVQ
ncbi:hypothetical protein QTP86_010132 [Hemibagrus guttatus]|nr:hypothetical protein QTP86_010132 [Hemibagrus guttatus]